MHKNDTLILCCASVRRHLNAAQQKMGTDFPVQELGWENHREPALLHETLLRTMAELPEGITTVLSCVCSCGGVWEGVTLPCRVVLPKMDDCVTMMLQTDDTLRPDVKHEGHNTSATVTGASTRWRPSRMRSAAGTAWRSAPLSSAASWRAITTPT